jgi:hypothetical protein
MMLVGDHHSRKFERVLVLVHTDTGRRAAGYHCRRRLVWWLLMVIGST